MKCSERKKTMGSHVCGFLPQEQPSACTVHPALCQISTHRHIFVAVNGKAWSEKTRTRTRRGWGRGEEKGEEETTRKKEGGTDEDREDDEKQVRGGRTTSKETASADDRTRAAGGVEAGWDENAANNEEAKPLNQGWRPQIARASSHAGGGRSKKSSPKESGRCRKKDTFDVEVGGVEEVGDAFLVETRADSATAGDGRGRRDEGSEVGMGRVAGWRNEGKRRAGCVEDEAWPKAGRDKDEQQQRVDRARDAAIGQGDGSTGSAAQGAATSDDAMRCVQIVVDCQGVLTEQLIRPVAKKLRTPFRRDSRTRADAVREERWTILDDKSDDHKVRNVGRRDCAAGRGRIPDAVTDELLLGAEYRGRMWRGDVVQRAIRKQRAGPMCDTPDGERHGLLSREAVRVSEAKEKSTVAVPGKCCHQNCCCPQRPCRFCHLARCGSLGLRWCPGHLDLCSEDMMVDQARHDNFSTIGVYERLSLQLSAYSQPIPVKKRLFRLPRRHQRPALPPGGRAEGRPELPVTIGADRAAG
ncbi:hypothetical protein C8R45DRAFT_941650 [Mycena sanguinolenta]|nr:hypothetical protein C8R45DRAFT_941650 [Mycena sanguinolenta]